jgi:hypothetical protein
MVSANQRMNTLYWKFYRDKIAPLLPKNSINENQGAIQPWASSINENRG